MLKRFSWIAVLFATLAILFAGCTQLGDQDDGTGPSNAPNPIVDGAKYLEIGKRTNSWDSLDIRAGKAKQTGNFTEGKEHSITIYGKASASLPGISLGQTDNQYSKNWGWGPAEANGYFTIKAKVPWADIEDVGNNKRINMPLPPTAYYIYEVVINDGDKDIYKLSEDPEIQDLEDQAEPFPDDTVVLKWWVKAGTPVVKVVAPGAGEVFTVTFALNGGAANGSAFAPRKVVEGGKLGKLYTPRRAGYVFVGWFDNDAEDEDGNPVSEKYEGDAIIVTKSVTLTAKWLASGSSLDDGTLTYAAPSWTGGGITYTNNVASFPQANGYAYLEFDVPTDVVDTNGYYPQTYNYVDLTLLSTGNVEITIKKSTTNDDVVRYPNGSGNAYVSLKKDVPLTFGIALGDLGGDIIRFQQRSNGAGDVTLVSAVFKKGTLHNVTFDKGVQLKVTQAPTQKILSTTTATEPTGENWIINGAADVYDFLGWYLDGVKYDWASPVGKDINLLSQWSIITERTVSFDFGAGKLPAASKDQGLELPQSFATTISVGTGSNPTRAGIVVPPVEAPAGVGSFLGWYDITETPVVQYTDATDTVVAPTTALTRDVTLTPLWDTTITLVLGTGTTPNVADEHSWAGQATAVGNGFGPILGSTYAVGTGLTIDFLDATGYGQDGSRQAAFIPLTDAQFNLIKGAHAISKIEVVVSSLTGTFRVGLANKDTYSGWNGTQLNALTGTTSTFTSNIGWQNGAPADNSKLKYFIIQRNGGTEQSLTVTSIKITFY